MSCSGMLLRCCCMQNGCTALHLAAMQGHKDAVEALLECDSQPNAQDKVGLWRELCVCH